jgi:hypothetical protein
MARQEHLDQVKQMLGSVPGWIDGLPDDQLEHLWPLIVWQLSDTTLTAQQKALVAFGAAGAAHCPY